MHFKRSYSDCKRESIYREQVAKISVDLDDSQSTYVSSNDPKIQSLDNTWLNQSVQILNVARLVDQFRRPVGLATYHSAQPNTNHFEKF